MIAYLKGKILYETDETAVIDVGGVGYEVYMSQSAFAKNQGKEIAEVYTYLQVKEDGMTLYGFSSQREKETFLKLISVSGVGPKMGIGVLATISGDELLTVIQTADVKRLSSVKGLGKKTAEKIILELHGKISAMEIMDASDTPVVVQEKKLSPMDEDAVEALIGLGYKRADAVQAVKKAREMGATTVEELIMYALRSAI